MYQKMLKLSKGNKPSNLCRTTDSNISSAAWNVVLSRVLPAVTQLHTYANITSFILIHILSQLRGYSIMKSGFGFIVNGDSDYLANWEYNSNVTRRNWCLCWLLSYFAHFNYSQPRCCLLAAVIAIDVFLKSFIIVSTHCWHHAQVKQTSSNICQIQIRIQ